MVTLKTVELELTFNSFNKKIKKLNNVIRIY